MTGSHDPRLVLLSLLVAAMASYCALDLASRVAGAGSHRAARRWLVAGALAMGAGIWAMHFVGMLAFRLPVPMAYDVPVTLASALIATAVAALALHVASQGTLGLPRLLLAGLAMGGGIAAMHYTGMAGLELSPAPRYDPLLLALSVVIAVAAAIVALRITFALRSSDPLKALRKRIAGALVMGAGIAGTHYTGMAATVFAADSVCTTDAAGLDNTWLAVAVGAVALVTLATTLLVSLLDTRAQLQRQAAAGTLQQAEQRLQHQVTQRQQAEAVARGQMQVLQMIATGAPVAEVLDALMRFIETLAPDVLASVLLLDADGRHLRHGAAPSLPKAYTEAIDGAEIGPVAGSCGTAAHRKATVIVEDLDTDPLWREYRALAAPHGLRACWSTPIFDAAGQVLGTFAMYRRETGGPGEHHRWLIDIATQSAAIAISHAAAQAALQGHMAVLRSTLEHMDQGIVILDPALRIVSANQRLQQLYDYPARLCEPGTPFTEVVRFSAERGDYGPGDAAALAEDRMAPVQRREPHRIVRERGNGAVLDVRGTPLPDGGYVVTYTDVSVHQRNEREALRFRAALDLSNDGIYLADVQRLVIVDVNAGACRALGYTREELIGLSVEKIFADRTLEQMREQYGRIVAGDDSRANFEAVHRRKDGSVFPVEISRRVHRTPTGPLLVGVARDISAHKQAQEALRGSEETLRVIVEDALDAAVRIDADGLVIGWNAQATRSFGWTAAEAHGRRLSELIVPPRHRAGHEYGMRRFLATGEGPVLNRRVEMHALRRDGQEIPVELSVTPVRTATGWVFSAFLRDLTAARASEAARATLEAQLREAQKMEAIGTLAGGIAHDFNNILAAILANAEFARQALGGSEVARAELAQIRQSAQRARSLVQQILTFGRRQDQRLRALPLAPLVEEVRALMRALLPAGVAVDCVPCDEPLWVMGDATQLQQVLMNLCTNGWQALQGHAGEIEIGLEAVAEAGGRLAHLWVRDTGSGMDAATRARMFEPFYTTKPVGQGTGLGLSVVHGIVASHQGRIGVDSTPGAGSCFHVYLPLVAAEVATTGPGALAEAPVAGAGEHVLVIDDDETMAIVVERLLGRAGYRVTTCLQAGRGVDLVRRDPEAFDLVVTDYNMPELSGFDVARELALLRPDLPVVVSSGYVTEVMRAEAQAIGVRALLRKENTIEELAALVRAVTARPTADAAR